jgi:ankyrin repeat protein
LGVEIDPESPQYISRICSYLDDIGVQKRSAELVQHADTLSIGGASAGDMCLYLLRYAIYLGSNNLLCSSKLDKLLQWVIRSERLPAVERLIATKTPSVEVFAAQLLVSAARLGELGVARTIINWGVDVNGLAQNHQGVKKTALKEAVQSRNTTLVRLLLDAGANPNTHDEQCEAGKTPLRTAITGYRSDLEIAEMLIKRGADVNTHTDTYGSWTLLTEAVRDGDIDAVRVLLAAGARVNDVGDETALQIAVTGYEFDEIVQLLLDAGADVDCPAGNAYADYCRKAAMEYRYSFFRTPLQRAVSANDVEMCQIILEAGADVNGFPAAGYARRISLIGHNEGRFSGHFNDVDIHEEGEGEEEDDDNDDDDDDYSDDEKVYAMFDRSPRMCTALQEAVLQNNFVLVRLLLSLGAHVNAIGSRGTALQIAARKPEGYKMARLLLSKGAEVNSSTQVPWSGTALQNAALSGNEDMVKLLLNQGAHVNAAPGHRRRGRTALQAATESGKMGLVELLVNAGAYLNANAAPQNGRTCLQCAVERENMDLVNYLLRLGADVNSPASKQGGRTALQAAVKVDNLELVELLLEVGADVRARTDQEDGLQLLCTALSNQSYELAQLLLDNGADPNESSDFESPLMIAVDNGAVEMIRCLILAGADVNRRPDGMTALETAAGHGREDIVSLLIDEGATLDGIDGTMALERAVLSDSIEVVKLLLVKGVSPNRPPATPYDSRESALYQAVTGQVFNVDMLRLLLHHGADAKEYGGICLQKAARNGSRDAVQILLTAGADVNFPPLGVHFGKDAGYTALQAAILSERPERMDIVHILFDAGADINGFPSDARGVTALQAAVGVGDRRMVRFLLSRGADVNGPPSKFYGATALQRAVIDGRLGIALVLLQAGADINAPAAEVGGRTALDAAAEHGRLDLACLLLQSEDDADAEAVRMRCRSAATLASSNGHPVLARILQDWKTSAA